MAQRVHVFELTMNTTRLTDVLERQRTNQVVNFLALLLLAVVLAFPTAAITQQLPTMAAQLHLKPAPPRHADSTSASEQLAPRYLVSSSTSTAAL